MGAGLKRAFAATARTRADANLTHEMRRFLEALPKDGRPITPKSLPLLCTEAQNQARKRCRRFGYTEMSDGILSPKGWQILPAGLRALATPTHEARHG